MGQLTRPPVEHQSLSGLTCPGHPGCEPAFSLHVLNLSECRHLMHEDKPACCPPPCLSTVQLIQAQKTSTETKSGNEQSAERVFAAELSDATKQAATVCFYLDKLQNQCLHARRRLLTVPPPHAAKHTSVFSCSISFLCVFCYLKEDKQQKWERVLSGKHFIRLNAWYAPVYIQWLSG